MLLIDAVCHYPEANHGDTYTTNCTSSDEPAAKVR